MKVALLIRADDYGVPDAPGLPNVAASVISRHDFA